MLFWCRVGWSFSFLSGASFLGGCLDWGCLVSVFRVSRARGSGLQGLDTTFSFAWIAHICLPLSTFNSAFGRHWTGTNTAPARAHRRTGVLSGQLAGCRSLPFDGALGGSGQGWSELARRKGTELGWRARRRVGSEGKSMGGGVRTAALQSWRGRFGCLVSLRSGRRHPEHIHGWLVAADLGDKELAGQEPWST